ncbi:MAG TPA: WYL domain-containing protein [Gemmatimonadaceae bacterium]|nr:WYL domain-containing protein [Gemmatimonadaceae bacterium]
MARAGNRKTIRTASAPGPSKLQRWLDVLAALLSHRYPITLDRLRREVPAYQRTGNEATFNRMFERDKDEMRAFGIPIETVQSGDPPEAAYQLRAADFYLPFMELSAVGGSARRSAARRAPFTSLQTLTFSPDELSLIAQAAARVRALGDPLLAADADSALRKLAFDLPVDALARDAERDERVVADQSPASRAIFALLGQALLAHKRVSFTYHAMGADSVREREVEPYGLVFLGSHWYVAAAERGDDVVRNFRLNRMSNVAMNHAKMRTPDFVVPDDFRLAEHARSRQAWELGDQEVEEILVEVRAPTGAATAAAQLGEPVAGHPERRCFRVRRADTFARWLLGFAGDLVPVAPPDIVRKYRELALETLRQYEEGA